MRESVRITSLASVRSGQMKFMHFVIGHVFVGPGHPNQEWGSQGRAPLPGTRHSERLMRKGSASLTDPRVLVKGEWDEADKWMRKFVDAPTP